MDITKHLSDEVVLRELGDRIARYRLNGNLTQAQLAKEAGVSLSTVNRIESGRSAQFSNLVRLLRTLDLLTNLELLIPEPAISPMQQIKLQGKARQRARPGASNKPERSGQPWSWDIPDNQRSTD